MKVKIRNVIFDSTEQPIMLILSAEDRKNIAKMLPDARMFCSAPDSMADEDIEKFMDVSEGLTFFPTGQEFLLAMDEVIARNETKVGEEGPDLLKAIFNREFILEFIDASHIRLTPLPPID